MKKQTFMAVVCLLAAASCSTETETQVLNNEAMAPVTVHVKDFCIVQEDFPTTRATAVGDYDGIQALTLVFYKPDGTQQYKCTHIKNDPNATYTTFGEFSTSLPLGSYTMAVMGYDWNQELTFASSTVASFGTGPAHITFADAQAVNITNTTAVNLTATLQRIVTALAVRSTDNRPAGVTHMRITYSAGSRSFNPTTCLAANNNGFVDLITFGGNVGAPIYSGDYFFLNTDEQTMDVNIETLDGEDGNVLFSKTFANVPFKRNRQTTLQGPIFTDGSANAGSFMVNVDWITPVHTIEF